MGTRTLVHVKTEGADSDTLVTIYGQFDGYPSGMGCDIKDLLGNKEVVNGYDDSLNQVNGMGCAAAMLIAELKKGCGGVYIRPVDCSNVGEEYTYTLWTQDSAIHMRCIGYREKIIFDGPLSVFDHKKAEKIEEE